jgi:hypothetical protein
MEYDFLWMIMKRSIGLGIGGIGFIVLKNIIIPHMRMAAFAKMTHFRVGDHMGFYPQVHLFQRKTCGFYRAHMELRQKLKVL